ncbi:hypothetical protein KI387_025879 [Taxus chinensis]|uniref:Glycosyl hydrolase family 95 N-terminal domain-containing protein n=1 Tax=Taxus chinensis TaxID=29808 RepID=A0AA38FWN2_TAXCH|nr:hypothetical protein KI387_025879 [Taxus chinensis]
MANQCRKEVGFETGASSEDWVVVSRNERSTMFSSPSVIDEEAEEDLKVEFFRPAEYWTDALPVGNGRLGAMVWGGVQQELLQLNEGLVFPEAQEGDVMVFSGQLDVEKIFVPFGFMTPMLTPPLEALAVEFQEQGCTKVEKRKELGKSYLSNRMILRSGKG